MTIVSQPKPLRRPHLFTSRRFFPMFAVQFLGALNDNLFRNAIFVLVTFELAARSGLNAPMIVSVGAGLFILPFFLFSATAGTVVDRYPKTRLVQILKLLELVLSLGAGASLIIADVSCMLGMLFLLGIQAAFFGPVKYSILPQLVDEDELVAANAYVEGGTFLAILLGTILGGIAVTLTHGTYLVAGALAILSVIGWLVSFAVPSIGASDPNLHVRWRFLSATLPIMRDAFGNKSIWRAILGISWFWFVGAIFLSVLPNYVKDVLKGGPFLVTFLLTIFSVGIGVGSVACTRLLKGKIDASYVPFAGITLGAAILTLYHFSERYVASSPHVTVSGFLSETQGLLIVFALVILAVAGGIFTVPLYTIMQARSDERYRARIIAANNIMNSLFMVISSVFTLAMFKFGRSVPEIFLVLAIFSFLVAAYICKLMTQSFMKSIFRLLLRFLYGVKISGLENFEQIRERGAVIIVNHTSLIDGILLAGFLPGFPTFAVNTQIAEAWWAKIFLNLVDHHIIDSTKPLALKSLVNVVEEGRHVVIFPEGRITMTGALMKIYEGPGLIAQKAHAPVVPIRINGAQHTPFSYLRGKVHITWFPKISISILPPVILETEPGLTSRERRQATRDHLYNIMADMMFATCNIDRTLIDALSEARLLNGGHAKLIEDIERHPMDYNHLIRAIHILGHSFKKFTAEKEYVGIFLPNSVGVAVVFFALVIMGRVPAMLNFTSGSASLRAACNAAQLRNILTSRRFIERAKLGPVLDSLKDIVSITYVEDIRSSISLTDKLFGVIASWFMCAKYNRLQIKPDDAAVILFTSGSEGTPKGVVLSHKNILANRYQLGARIDFNSSDIVFNALPVFHSFGLTAGLLLPILSGVRTFLYPSPLHYRIIAELAYDTNATILFGTDTFLTGYARMANAYDFYSVRYVFAGAERVKKETRDAWQEKFGVRILEGYGATETSPTLAINTAMHAKVGSVGRLLPGIEHRLVTVSGVAEGGRLTVRGPNVMRGYLKSSAPGVLEPPEDGWYDTGDIVTLDRRGFVTIIGRVKRFAKIGGEMVSLGAVENYIQALYPDKPIAVVAIADEKKGEQLVVFTDNDAVNREAIMTQARALKLGELMIPRQIVKIDKIPVLGTGKTDYVTLNKIAQDSKAGPRPPESIV